MRKRGNNGTKAILGLAAASIVVIGASIAISLTNGNGEPAGQTNITAAPTLAPGNHLGNEGPSGTSSMKGEKLDLTGAGSKIIDACRNQDGTYTVAVKEDGYIGPMKLEITYSADGKTVLGYEVTESQETQDLGTKVNEDVYKSLLAGTTLPIYASGMDISAVINAGDQKTEQSESVPAVLRDGTYEAVSEPAGNGYISHVKMTIENGKIVSVVWDEEKPGTGWKSELSTTGKYVMKPVWDTQAKAMCQYVVDHQGTTGLNLTEAGKTDAVSGVSISVNGFTALVEQAVSQAAGKDGEYKVVGEPAGNGYVPHVSVTISGGKITAVTWDEEKGGEWKSVLSTTGKYVMKPVWDTQAKAMSQYVIDHQGTTGLNLTEAGKTDAVSGVSISVNGFVDLVNNALTQALAEGGTVKPQEPAKDTAPLDATLVEVVSGATYSSRAVIRAINEGYVFLRDHIIK